MKDPLQETETPYEILDVPVTADKKAIDAAFRKAMAKVGNVTRARDAWNTLSKPVERGFTDLLLYNNSFIDQMIPRLKEPSQLLERRAEIAQSWSRIQKNLFPNFAAAHSLALLWYWWAIYCEEERWAQATNSPANNAANLTDAYPISTLWSNAIAYWVFLINSEAFWDEWLGSATYITGNGDIDMLRRKIEDHFVNLFHTFAERYRSRNISESSRRFPEYELMLSTEMKTARQLMSENLKLSMGGRKFAICCGRMMLEQVDMLDALRKQIEIIFERNPANQKLADLASALSPFAAISVLLERKKYDEALQAISSLAGSEQKKSEVLRLRARALLEKGKQHFSVNQFKKALDSWKQAIDTREISEEVRSTITSLCQSKAASLQNSDPEMALSILERAMKLVKDENLKLTLAEIITQRGITKLNDAQKQLESEQCGLTAEILALMEEGLADLKRAEKLGSKRAAENAQVAVQVIAQAKSGLMDLSPAVLDLMQRANQAADRGDWNTAISSIKKAVEQSSGNAKETLKKQLAQMLNASAIEKINELMPKINAVTRGYQESMDARMMAFIASRSKGSSPRGKVSGCFMGLGELWFLALVAGLPGGFQLVSSDEDWKQTAGVMLIIISILSVLIRLVSFLGNISASWTSQLNFGQTSAPRCAWCGNEASYQFNLNNAPLSLCYSHADELRTLTEKPMPLDFMTFATLGSAVIELAEAARLDPSSSIIRQNHEDVKAMASRFSLSTPEDERVEKLMKQFKDIF